MIFLSKSAFIHFYIIEGFLRVNCLLSVKSSSHDELCYHWSVFQRSDKVCLIKVASDPVITSLNQTSATSVRVEWSQPSGGATVTGYVVHYSDGDTDRTESVPASSTSSLITGLTDGLNYTFLVEATSEHLSGMSCPVIIIMG